MLRTGIGLVNENDDDIVTHDWEDYIDSKSHVRRILKDLKSGESELIYGFPSHVEALTLISFGKRSITAAHNVSTS